MCVGEGNVYYYHVDQAGVRLKFYILSDGGWRGGGNGTPYRAINAPLVSVPKFTAPSILILARAFNIKYGPV